MYLEIKNVNKTISKNVILNNINLGMELGKIYGLRGINGSGKTMLMRCICGLVHPDSGQIQIAGKQLGKEYDFPESVGALLETPGFIEHYTAYSNLKELASIKQEVDDERIREVLDEVGLDYQNRKRVKKYSLGMRQKLGIAIAFMEKPTLLVLDEPFNSLDAEGVERTKKLIINSRDNGALVIISCHDSAILDELSEEVFQIENGCIIGHYFPRGEKEGEEDNG